MTWLQPASRNISALMQPVNAPEAAAWQSWPPSATPPPASASPPSTPLIGPSSVAGGQTSRSQACGSFARSAMARASAIPSARRPFIFQLPATSAFRSGISVLHAARASAPANVAARPGHLYVRTYDHTGLCGGQPAAIPAKSGILRMMQWIRGRAGSIIVKALFALLIISFGFWGIYTRSDYYSGHSPDTVVAAVGDRNIRAEDLQRALEPALQRLRAQFGTSIDQRQVKQLGILDTLLGQLIDRSLIDQEAARLGLEVSDEGIRGAIYANPAFRGPDGKFDRQLFAQVLSMNRLSEDQLVARLRHDIPRSDLVQAVTAGIAVPRPVVDALYRYRNEKRLADIVAFPAASVTDIGQPSEADLGKFYDSHPDLFRAPEYRGFTIASLSPGDLEQPGEIAEDELRKEYEQRKDEFETPDRREIQQILSPSEEK